MARSSLTKHPLCGFPVRPLQADPFFFLLSFIYTGGALVHSIFHGLSSAEYMARTVLNFSYTLTLTVTLTLSLI